MVEEFLAVAQHIGNHLNFSVFDSCAKEMDSSWYGTLKIDTDVGFSDGKIDIDVLIINHLSVPFFLAKVVPRYESFFVDFG